MRDRVTLLANMLFAFNGIICLLPGVVLMEIGNSFQVDTYVIGYIYTLFTLGNITAVQFNGRILEGLDIRKLLLVVVAIFFTSVIGITTAKVLGLFAFFIFTFGIANGFFSSTASYLIVNLYNDKQRSTRLNLLHFFFGVGAIISPLLSGTLLKMGVGWENIYRLVLILLAGVACLLWVTPVTVERNNRQKANNGGKQNLGLGVYAIALSLFCYTIAEGSFMFWGNTFFIEYLGLDISKARFLISTFWVFMAVGRLLSGHILRKMSVETYILVSAGLAFIAFTMLVNSKDYFIGLILTSLMGFGFAGLYASILSYGTLKLECASAKLISLYITFGSLGGLTAAPLSSWLKHYFDLKAALTVCSMFMAIVFILIAAISFVYRYRAKPHCVID